MDLSSQFEFSGGPNVSITPAAAALIAFVAVFAWFARSAFRN
jgi:hypothetical protein